MAAGSIVVDLLMRTGSFETDTKRAEATAKKRADAIGKAFEDMGQKIGIAAAAAATALTAMVVSTANTAKEITNLAQLSGAGTQEFQRFAAAAKSVGVEQDQLGDIFKDFREKIGEFVSTGGGEMKDFFEQIAPKIGITADAFRNLSGPQALQLYFDSLQKAGLSTEQMSFYLESAANDATKLIPVMRDGGKAITELGDAAERTGQIMSDSTIAAAKELSDQISTFTGLAKGMTNEIMTALLPSLIEVGRQMTAVGSQTNGAKIIADGIATVFETVAALGVNVAYVLVQIKNELVGLAQQAAAVARLDFGEASAIGDRMKASSASARVEVDRLTESILNARRTSQMIAGLGDTGDAISRRFMRTPSAGGLPWSPPITTKTPKASAPKATKAAKEEVGPFVGPLPDESVIKRYLELEREALSLKESLMTADEKRAAQLATWQEMMDHGLLTQEQFNKLIAEPAEEGYWEKWLESAENALTNFDELANGVIQNFSTGFGNAFEKMVFDSESLGEAISGLADSMARSIVNALGQMAAQWLAYQVVQMMVGKTTATTAAAAIAFEAQAASLMAGINAFASTAAIPIVGPAMAPAAMGAALAVTEPMAASVAALSAAAAGARATGGPVSADQAYLVGERGPELFVPNTSGSIVPNNRMNGGSVTVNLIEDKSRAGKTESRMNNGAQELDVFVADIMGDGPRSKAIRQAFGLQRRGY